MVATPSSTPSERAAEDPAPGPGRQRTGDAHREPTALDAIADAYFRAKLRLDPAWAIELGAPDHGWGYRDWSPAGLEAEHEVTRSAAAELARAVPADDVDRVTAHALGAQLSLETRLHEAGLAGPRIDNISSPVQKIREAFDNLPKYTEQDWEVIERQLRCVPEAVDSAIRGLRHRQEHGPVTASAQLANAARQAAGYAGPEGSFMNLSRSSRVTQLPAALREDVYEGVGLAREAYARFAAELRALAPEAPAQMAVGADEYRLRLQQFTGLRPDLAQTYEWGVDLLQGIVAEMNETAQRILPDHAGPDRIRAAMSALDEDPHRQLRGRHQLLTWMQGVTEHALDALSGTHFDITDRMRRIECRIAPTSDGGIYYTPPSSDFRRPGRMWWSVPEGKEVFRTWGERTTVYHEGVPGHHLQFSHVAAHGDHLNLWRRLGLWVSGHGEGWALYAERLMGELGFFQDDGDRMGMLNAQRMRAARVVFDIGFHCGYEIPQRLGEVLGAAEPGRVWNPQDGWEFLRANIVMDPDSLRYEWMRYMGWPGQAPSYSLGQRAWERARHHAAARAGGGFDLPAFHSRALGLGSVGLETLDYALGLPDN
ncbi:DUF885 domain-containing protein [Kocuria palustris]|uniref:DUF885 domain-containing protein n=1 Tax=Kocuria palustris TaxID=71999 RepID=UPI0011A85C96|nr:DUF885 domain-containing protein [Kocuria palustris]